MTAPRSWIFIIPVLLIRHSVALESKNADFTRSISSEEYSHPDVFKRALNGISLLTARANDHPARVGAIVGGTLGGVAIIGLCAFAFVYHRRRERVASIEDGIQPPERKTSWRDRLKVMRRKRPQPSPSDESLVAPRELPSSESSSDAAIEEKGPTLQVQRAAADLRDTPPVPNPNPTVFTDRPLPPAPSQKMEVAERTSTFILALPSNHGSSHPSLKSYDTSRRSSRRKVQIPPRAVIIGNPITLKSTSSKRQSRSGDMYEGVRKYSKTKHEPRRRSLLSGFRPPVSQEIPSQHPITQTDTVYAPAQGINRDQFQRILEASRQKEREVFKKFASTLPGHSAQIT